MNAEHKMSCGAFLVAEQEARAVRAPDPPRLTFKAVVIAEVG